VAVEERGLSNIINLLYIGNVTVKFLLAAVDDRVECESILPTACEVHHFHIFIPAAICKQIVCGTIVEHKLNITLPPNTNNRQN